MFDKIQFRLSDTLVLHYDAKLNKLYIVVGNIHFPVDDESIIAEPFKLMVLQEARKLYK